MKPGYTSIQTTFLVLLLRKDENQMEPIIYERCRCNVENILQYSNNKFNIAIEETEKFTNFYTNDIKTKVFFLFHSIENNTI